MTIRLNEPGVLVEAPNGIFSRAIPVLDSTVRLADKFKDAPGEHVDDLHCTIMYSKTNFNGYLPYSIFDKDKRYSAYPEHVTYWPGDKGDGYLVLEINSPDLLMAHTQWRIYGLEPSYEVYKAHVTLSHPVDEEQARRYCLKANSDPLLFLYELKFYNGGYVPLPEEL